MTRADLLIRGMAEGRPETSLKHLNAIGAGPIMPSACNGRNGRNLVLFVSELSELSSNYHVSHCVLQVKWPNGIEYDGEWKADSALGSRSRWE